jgi:hypothetical protein
LNGSSPRLVSEGVGAKAAALPLSGMGFGDSEDTEEFRGIAGRIVTPLNRKERD